jgi:hypothetical protein
VSVSVRDERHLNGTKEKLHSFLNLELEAGKWLASRHDRFTTKELTHRYLMNRRLGEPYRGASMLWKADKFLSLMRNRTPKLSQHTDSAVRTPNVKVDVTYMKLYFTKLERWNLKPLDVTYHLLVPKLEDFIGT